MLTATVIERGVLRYTPAGLPAIDLQLEHASEVVEAGQSRNVKVSIKAVALGIQAEVLSRQVLGSCWRFNGFLATPHSRKHPVFHIQDFQQD